MLSRSARLAAVAAVAAVVSSPISPASASGDGWLNPVPISEWPVSHGGRPRDPYAVSVDEVWFAGQSGNYIARLRPSKGSITKIDLEDAAGPHNLIVGSDGMVWYAGNLKGYIGRLSPEDGTIERIEMPDAAVRDPHTLIFDADESHIWFTAQRANVIGRLTLATRAVDLIPVPTPRARPYGIKIAPDGMVWAVLFGSNKLARVDPQTLTLTEIDLLESDTRPRRLEITGDGRVWYSDYARGRLGLYDPATKTFGEWLLPAGDKAQPYGTALDGRGRVWVAETGVSPNRLVAFDTATENFVSVTPIPSGAGSVRHMFYLAEDQTVWFGTDASTVGRILTGDN